MAKLTRDEFISSLKEMNLLEIKELVDARGGIWCRSICW